MRRNGIILLAFLVAGSVFIESWHAAANAAKAGGRPWPWFWPVTLEAFIAVLVLVYWEARAEHRRARTARGMLVLTTVVASAVQALDAPTNPLGILTAAWTPVSLLLTVEFATWLLYGKAQEVGAPAPAALPVAPANSPAGRPHATPPSGPAPPLAGMAPPAARSGASASTPAMTTPDAMSTRQQVAAMLDHEDPANPWTGGRVAAEVGVTRSRASRLLTEERAKRNGHGGGQ